MLSPRWFVLYEEGNQKDLATQKLSSMQDFLAAHPDPHRAAQLEELAQVGRCNASREDSRPQAVRRSKAPQP